jgi:hypothetical protein
LINLVARASTSGAIVTPICFAVFKLITNSNLLEKTNFISWFSGFQSKFLLLKPFASRLTPTESLDSPARETRVKDSPPAAPRIRPQRYTKSSQPKMTPQQLSSCHLVLLIIYHADRAKENRELQWKAIEVGAYSYQRRELSTFAMTAYGRTVMTGQGASVITRSATLPKKSLGTPFLACVHITIISTPSSRTKLTMPDHGR